MEKEGKNVGCTNESTGDKDQREMDDSHRKRWRRKQDPETEIQEANVEVKVMDSTHLSLRWRKPA